MADLTNLTGVLKEALVTIKLYCENKEGDGSANGRLMDAIQKYIQSFSNDKIIAKATSPQRILIAEVKKKAKFEDSSNRHITTFVSFDRDKLKAEIEDHYKIELKKDEADEFPYFTDGGFKYGGENENWFFETAAYWFDII